MLIVGCGEKDTQPPRVVSTIPVNESADVDSSITEISVKFNEEMMDGNWSWAYDNKSEFPQIVGQNGKSLRTGPRVQSGFASISVTQIRE
jgi:hypothetical protein